MTTTPPTLIRFRRDARRLAQRIVRKLTHKADLSIAVTVSLPPFVKVVVTYKLVSSYYVRLGANTYDQEPCHAFR